MQPDQHSSTRVKRKPPPAFPYSSRYPPPDVTDPFAPLAVLRERAHSSKVTLVSPPDEPFANNAGLASPEPITEFSHSRYIPHTDTKPSDYSHNTPSYHYHGHTPKTSDGKTTPSRPWRYLTPGYFTEATKPLRPPRSRGRPGRESVSYFSDVDVTSDPVRQQDLPRPSHHPNLAKSSAEPQRRQIDVSAQSRDSQYHYRRRSKSVFVLPSTSKPATTSVSPNVSSPPRADPSRQYTYDDRQSHGYMFDDYDLGFDQPRDHQQVSANDRQGTRSPISTDSDSSRHPTPPMTADDTLSSMSVSPRDNPAARSASSSPSHVPQLQTKPSAFPGSKLRPSNVRVVRDPLPHIIPVQDTPASIHSSDFPLLLPPSPPSVPPTPSLPPASPSPNLATAPPPPPPSIPHAHTHAHAHAPYASRHTESEPEVSSPEPTKRRRVTSIDSMRRRLRKSPAVVTGVRGKQISSPTPLLPSGPGRKASFASDSSISVAHGNEASSSSSVGMRGAGLSANTRSDTEAGPTHKLPNSFIPKPKKSLSHVNLHLKPLPNLSMQGHFVASSGNPSMASAIGNNALLRPPEVARDNDVSAPSDQKIIAPPPRISSMAVTARVETHLVRPSARTAGRETTPPTHFRRTIFITRQESYESEEEDESTFTALIALRELLSPFPAPSALDNLHAQYTEYAVTEEPTPAVAQDYLEAVDPTPPQTPAKPERYTTRPRALSPTPFEAPDAIQRRSASPVEMMMVQPARSVERFVATQRSESPSPSSRSPVVQPRSESPVHVKRSHALKVRSPSPIEVQQVQRRSQSPVRDQGPVAGPSQRRPESPVHAIRPSVEQKRSESPIHVNRPSAVQKRPESPIHPLAQRPSAVLRPESPDRPKPPRASSADQAPRTTRLRQQSESPIPARAARRSESPVHLRPALVSKRSESPVYSKMATQRRSDSPVHTLGESSLSAQQRSASPIEPVRRPSPVSRNTGSSTIYKRSESPVHLPSHRRATSPEQRVPPHRAEQPVASRSVPIPSTRRVETPANLPLSPPVPYKDMSPSPWSASSPASRAFSPPSRAKSPVSPEFDNPPAFRAPSPPVVRPQRRPSTDKKQIPKREGSKDDQSDYLPIAQLRNQPQLQSKQQSGSLSSRRKPSAQSSTVFETQSVQSRARSATVTSETSTVVLRAGDSIRGVRRAETVEEETPVTPAKDLFTSLAPRRQRTAPSTPALILSSPLPTGRSHAYPSKKAESYSHSSRSKHSHSTQSRSSADFDENAIVSREQLARAASMVVIAQNGIRVPFGDLFKERKTIIIFIRHFWCAMDQDYMYSIAKNVDTAALRRADTDLVFVGNGAPGMIKSYRHIFRTPFSMYTDPGLRIHAALGMTKRSNDPGPEFEKGEYVRHGLVGGIAMVVRNALKVGMPVWEKGGETSQLGGEFVFGPGTTSTYAHRMKHTRAHAPILSVLAASGLQIYPTHQNDSQSTLSVDDEVQWMQNRDKSLDRMNAKRERRRRGPRTEGCNEEDVVAPDYESESGTASVSGSWELSPKRAASDPSEKIERIERKELEHLRTVRTARARHAKRSRRFHVSNPDHGDEYDPYQDEKDDAGRSGGGNTVSRRGKYGRNDRDDAYMLTHDAVAYSLGAQ